ncbi:hypothetical protein KFK09_010810 [Dendrobium nobile]|uniref:GATA-type domain-containing protein n=1 Tax=Dendrobium nobile TaxID=94219 RepID=A0A8T3BB01_DENNO|nr:hypothetical protein KFK09_010810 [Dendrobium nobile]
MAMKAFMEPMGTELVCEDPFDSIDDLLDFPNDDDALPIAEAWGDCAPLAPSPAPAPALMAAGSGGGISVGSAASGLDGRAAAVSGVGISSENDALGLYNDMDIANLEWLSNFFEDSEFNFDFIPNSTTPSTPDAKPENKTASLSRSSSPISVLLLPTSSSSSSSSSSSNSITDISPPPPPPASVPGRARTKRPRPPSFSARPFIPPSSNTPISSPAATKKMKRDLDSVPSMRKCSHCDIQKTPQWRAGPMGPKTLCNACGVRYKSGRLFPEYRPAASPTFVPAVHSNSHKKVVEMRLRCTEMAGKSGGREIPVAAKNCDLLEYIRRRD